MKELVLEAVKKFDLLDGVRHITVALSGGADSMSLLYVLLSLKDELGFELSAAHFNHMIRGDEADRDERFVRDECKKLGVEFISEQGDVPAFAEEHRMSIELAAREMRYDFLKRVNRGVVATAHTASDNFETMLFNLARGTSLKGICGIPPKRDIFIRPIIFCTRDDVETYCRENGIEYVTDSTNLSDDYARNKIRHQVIPLLKTVNSAAERNALRTGISLIEDNAFIENEANEVFLQSVNKDGFLDISLFERISPSVAKRVIKLFFARMSEKSLDSFHINGIYEICMTGGAVSLPDNLKATVADKKLIINDVCDILQNAQKYFVQMIKSKNNLFENGEKVNNLLLKNSLDCDKIIGKSVIRTRLPGDSIRIKNRGSTKTLKKLFNEYKIPIELRDSVPLIADEKGVVWIYGIGVAERCAVSRQTKTIIIIKTKIEDNNAF